MNSELRIGVVGAGIGGLAVACALAQNGAQVSLFEQASEISEVGAGLQISPNGLCVLRALGLAAALSQNACRGQSVSLRRAESDFEVAKLDLTRLPPSQQYNFVHRADLIDLLKEAALNAGVTINLNHKVSAVSPGTPATMHFKDREARQFDLVIDAGGLKSVLRATLNGDAPAFFTKQTAWRAVIPNTEGRVNDVQVHMAPRRHLVSYPIRNGEFLNLVAVQERDDWNAEGWSHEDDPANLRAVFKGADASVLHMLDQVETLHLWGLFRHPVAQKWCAEGCVLLGDAAHPTLPFLAQGANMALEDAWALAMSLHANRPLSDCLAAYQTKRAPRVTKVIEASNNNAWRYHLPRGPVRLAAHLVLGLGSRIAPQMMLSQYDWLYGYDITSEYTEI